MARVLVVDDDTGLRTFLAHALQKNGYEVREAKDGHEALAVYKDFPAEIIVLDIFMPRREGLETIRELRKITPEADDALQKPFPEEALLDAIKRNNRPRS
jgi:DNA-binding response OmpR family regulator